MRTPILILLAASGAHAGGFVPDRPAFADSPLTVDQGRFLPELGLATSRPDGGTALAPQLTVRYGLAERLELRADFSGLGVVPDRGSADAGLGSPGVGLKYNLPLQAFDLGVVGRLGMPTPSPGFGSEGFDGLLNASFATHNLGDLILGGNLGLAWSDGGDGHRLQGLGSLVAFYARGPGGVCLQGGATVAEEVAPFVGVCAYLALNPDWQLDVGYDHGLGAHGPPPTVHLGTSFRL